LTATPQPSDDVRKEIRRRFLRRKEPDDLTSSLAEGVRRGELTYEASTGQFRITKKGEQALAKALKEADRK
jgi:hypothetical protein